MRTGRGPGNLRVPWLVDESGDLAAVEAREGDQLGLGEGRGVEAAGFAEVVQRAGTGGGVCNAGVVGTL